MKMFRTMVSPAVTERLSGEEPEFRFGMIGFPTAWAAGTMKNPAKLADSMSKTGSRAFVFTPSHQENNYISICPA